MDTDSVYWLLLFTLSEDMQ